MQDNSVQDFIEKYKNFESIIRRKYDLGQEKSIYTYMKKKKDTRVS